MDRSSGDLIGARAEGGLARFRVWARGHRELRVVLFGPDGRTEVGSLAATADADGFFVAERQLEPGSTSLLYKLSPDGAGPFPDPASRSQPFGVHGPSEITEESFAWTDAGWTGVALDDLVIYEVHVGTATPEGTFDALVRRIPEIVALGVTALELMPIASFPGRRNWGYDGVSLWAPAAAYGGPAGLFRLVDAAHRAGLAILVDAVYNHLGPDGNYLRAFSAGYFTDRHATPWGDALDFDGDDAGPVREFFAENAAMWIERFHVDGLRLDATHAIQDASDPHVLRQIAERARGAAPGRRVLVIAEDERNDARITTPASAGGLGLDAVWADDFHHQMRRAFAGDGDGYFADFSGTAEDIARTLREGWFYEGQPSGHWGRARGTPADGAPAARFVHCIQNHDQIGNRAMGDRLGARVSAAAYRAMSALLLLSPYTPLIFMGQEWNATTPFAYFTDHHAELGRLVTEGRRREFASFTGFRADEIPDPQADETFARSKLDLAERLEPAHAGVLAWYEELLRLRRAHPCLRERTRGSWDARALGSDALVLELRAEGRRLLLVVNIRGELDEDLGAGALRVVVSSEEARFGGSGVDLVAGGAVRISGAGAVLLEVA